MNNDDDGEEADADSQNPSNSSGKSIDAASKNTVQSSHPYRVIEKDGLSIHSMQSLGRVGRILSGSLDPGPLSMSKESTLQNLQLESPTNAISEENSNGKENNMKKSEDSQSQSSNYSLVTSASSQIRQLQEPDVIASTKLSQSKTTDSVSDELYRLKQLLKVNYFRLHPLDLLRRNLSLLHVESATKIENCLRHPKISQLLATSR